MYDALLERVEACYREAEAFFGRRFPRPEVSLRLRGQKAGVAHLDDNRLRFNPQLYRENREDFLRQTVPHEVAHLVAHQVFGPRIRAHGEEWQRLMREVFHLAPQRCHRYEIVRPQRLHYVYRCQCAEEFVFTAQRHALVRKGHRYQCRRCRSLLVYTEQQRLA